MVDLDDPQVIVCAGPPACLLEDKAAEEAQLRGCQLCTRITVHPDGTETVAAPAKH